MSNTSFIFLPFICMYIIIWLYILDSKVDKLKKENQELKELIKNFNKQEK